MILTILRKIFPLAWTLGLALMWPASVCSAGPSIRTFDPVTAELNARRFGDDPFTQQPYPARMLVFISLTMPDASLRALLHQSHEWQVPLLIRGPLPSGFKATARRLMALLNPPGSSVISSGVAIDPEAFHQFSIQDVPAFVLIRPNRCAPQRPCTLQDHAVVKGNVSLRAALEALSASPLGHLADRLLKAHPQ
ncbi:type-F conjugative transfer system pilin assembly protein TrbC [Vibrio coralliilyticus]|jgi:conjugal transfer pilus assembly protein TrbC|uniref:type-F conjugative transfer system pilin assembly protein TrbC n=1 Tax=Vibrio coralliilyticus TaxID=190893 RepID=UPI003917525A